MTLESLLLRAELGGSAYSRHLFFRGCTYASGVLLVEDRAQGEMIGRLFGEQLRRVVADLRITVAQPTPPPEKPSGIIKAKALAKWEQARITNLD